MKKNLFSLLCISSLNFANAQTTIWFDDFDDMDTSDWTMIDSDGDGLIWDALLLDDGNNPKYPTPALRSQSWLWYSFNPDNYAISPAINIKDIVDGKLTLKWKISATDPDRDLIEQYTVYVSTSPKLEDIKKAEIQFTESSMDNVNTLTQRTLDVSKLLGNEKIYVTFRHHHPAEYDAWMIIIDDVYLDHTKNLATNDVDKNKVSLVTPNPITNEFKINHTSRNFQTIEIFDLVGNKVKTFTKQNEKYSISELPKGIYILKTIIDQKEYSQKIIKK